MQSIEDEIGILEAGVAADEKAKAAKLESLAVLRKTQERVAALAEVDKQIAERQRTHDRLKVDCETLEAIDGRDLLRAAELNVVRAEIDKLPAGSARFLDAQRRTLAGWGWTRTRDVNETWQDAPGAAPLNLGGAWQKFCDDAVKNARRPLLEAQAKKSELVTV